MSKVFTIQAVVAAMVVLQSRVASAHCDALGGPVVAAAKSALDRNDVALVPGWVAPDREADNRSAFDRTVTVWGAGGEAQALAETWFFETLVRIHRAGEGAAAQDPSSRGLMRDPVRQTTPSILSPPLTVDAAVRIALDRNPVTRAAAEGVRVAEEAVGEARAEAIAAAEVLIGDAEENVRIARERYRVGAGTGNELPDAQAALARADAVRAQAEWDYRTARATYDWTMGRALPPGAPPASVDGGL